MCAVSAMGDHYTKKIDEDWTKTHPWIQPWVVPTTPINPTPIQPIQWPPAQTGFPPPTVSREEFEVLKKQVQEMHEILKVAKEYDDRTDQHECEQEEKVALLKRIAELVGVDLKDVFG